MSLTQPKQYYWIYSENNDRVTMPWLQISTLDNSYGSNLKLVIANTVYQGATAIGYVDMGFNTDQTLARNEDWLELTSDIYDFATYNLSLSGVEYISAPLNKTVDLEVISKFGFGTNGSLHSITTGVGNHTIDYDGATRDSTLTMLAGWDSVNLIDHPDIPGTQYWTLIRRQYGELDAYSLFSGYRIRMVSGGFSMNNSNGLVNYGEIERIYLMDARSSSNKMIDPGGGGPNHPIANNARSIDTNIDLRSYETVGGVVANKPFSDSFNLAYFNFIRYTSDNIWAGQATIYDKNVLGRYSSPGNTSVAGAEVLDVIGTQRNGTHDLVVTEQANAIDGQLRLYAFNVQSRVYNVFNDVYLGTSGVDGKSYAVTNSATPEGRVALYGFGGKDILTGGAGNDYLFGGEAEYNQLVTGATGNQLTGGPGADYFGVGNTNANGAVDGAVSWAGYNGGQAQIGYAADQIRDWHAGTDTLRVLSNGVAIISGLYGVSGMADPNTIDLRATLAVVTSDQNNSGPRGGTTTGWDSVAGNLDYIYANQATRDAQSIKNQADVTVVNEGLIVARGLEDNDVIYGSPGNDYLYGNQGDNTLDLSNGGTDRAFYDTRSGKQFLGGFASASNDKVYLAKNVIDAFRGGSTFHEITTHQVSLAVADTANMQYSYRNGERYSQGIDYLYGVTYKAYLSNSFGSQPYSNVESQTMGFAADVTTFVAGAVMIGVAVGLCFIPFVGPALAAPLFVAGALLEAGKIYSEYGNKTLGSVEHLNAVYNLGYDSVLEDYGNFQTNYAYVLHNDLPYVNINDQVATPVIPTTSPATGANANIDNLPFLHFFHGAYTYDGFTPVLELNPGWGYGGDSDNGVHAYFIVYSNTETFVYFVTSQDNLIENGEAFKVAEVNGHLEASDFVVYDSNQDPYNQRADAPVVLKKPTISAVYENSAPTYTASVPNKAYTESPSLRVTGTIASIDPSKAPTTSTKSIVLYDAMQDPDDNGNPIPVETVSISSSDTSFTINDPRSLGQIIIQTDFDTTGATTTSDGSLSQPVASSGKLRLKELDNTFEYQDRRIAYYTSLLNDVDNDGSMIIELRSNTWNVIDNGPSNATVDGGNGSDTLLLESTSLHLNRAIDAQIVSIENINVKAPNGPGLSVSVSGGSIADVTVIDPNVMVADGVYTMQFKDADGTFTAPSSAWTITVSNRQVTGYTKGNGGSGFGDKGTYATADWIPLGVNIDVRAQTEGFNINAYNGADTIVGAQGNDNIYGLAGNDTIDGGNGNDTITGGAGLDSLLGGNGADIFVVSAVSDFANGEVIAGGANSAGTVDKLQLSQQAVGGTFGSFTTSASTGTYTAAQLSSQVTGVEVIELTVNASYSLTLSDGIYAGVDANGDGTADNTLTITPTVNITNDVTIVGGAVSGNNELVVQDSGYLDGNDSMVGGAGNDSLQGGDGNDTISGGSNADLIQSGNGNDWIVQTNQQTVLDTITGGAGSDTLTLTNDNAVTDLDHVTQVETIELLSGVGNTFSYTPSNNSAFDADSATGVVIDGDALAANEALRFDAGNLDRAITIWGGAGNDTIIDGAGHDSIVTNDGADTVLLSGGGNDTVQTGVGQDTLTLGNGNDSILMGSQNDVLYGQDRVTVADTLKGGADFDKLVLTNDNATDDLNNVTEFETIELTAGADYVYIIGDNSAFDLDTTPVTVDGSMLGAGDGVNFNATALDRSITIFFGTGNDTIHGGDGNDSLNSGGGNDLFLMEDRMDVDDSLDGGTGNDTLSFFDTTGTTLLDDLDHVTNIETIILGDSLTGIQTVDTLVASGQALNVDASGLTGTNTLTWNGAAETNGRFSVLGSSQADTITGGAQADTIVSGNGADSIVGGNGADSILTSDGADTVTLGGTGADLILSGNDNDLIAGGNFVNSDDTIDGGDGVDELSFSDNGTATSDLNQVSNIERIVLGDSVTSVITVDTLVASGSSLNLDARALTGTNTLTWNGGAESDGTFSILGSSQGDTITLGALADTIDSGSGADSLVLGTGNDSVQAGDGNDTIALGGSGSDSIDAGNDDDRIVAASDLTVADTLDGGTGNDTLTFTDATGTTLGNDLNFVTNIETIVLGDALTGITTLNTLVASGSSLNVDATVLTGSNTLSWDGSAESNGTFSILGSGQADTITGGALADTLVSGTGADSLVLGTGNDSVLAGDGNDTIVLGGSGSDSIDAGADDDLIVAASDLTVADTLDGGTGNDTLTFSDSTGNSATNDLNHVTNIETITLGDSLTSVTTVDTLVASGATLTINAVGLSGSNTLTWNGTAENDGRFSVLGSAQADSIVGGNQADTLVGGAGVDSLVGNDGDDAFVINSSVVDTTGVGETIAGGAGNDTLIVAAGTQAIHFSDDTLSSIEVLELTKTVTGAADSNAQTLTMTHAQLTGLSTVYAALGDSIILSDAVGSSALTGAVLDGTLTLQLANVGSNLLVLDSSNFDSSTDRLRVAASAVTSAVTVDAALETDGAVSVLTGDGNDLITGTDSAVGDTVSSGNGNDSIVGGEGADSVVAGAGNDTVLMSVVSVDTLDAGADTDWLALGGAAPGTVLIDLSVSAGSDQVLSINGSADSAVQMNFEHLDASLMTGAGVKVSTRASATSVIGTAQVDTIIGGAGADSIDSGGGADVIWAGKGGDKVSAGNGSKVLVVGDLSGASTEKLALINSTLNTMTGNSPGLTIAYTTEIGSGETITFDTTVTNELHLFGTVDLTGVTLTGTYNIYTYSNLTLTRAQLNAAKTINLVDNASGSSTHTLTIKENNGNLLTDDEQLALLSTWLDQNGQQLMFGSGGTPAPLSVASRALTYVASPSNAAHVNEKLEQPPTNVPAGNPIGANPNSTTLQFDKNINTPSVGDGDFADPVTISNQHFPIYAGDRFKGARFISDFEPGARPLPVPATFTNYGDNQVHNSQYEVYYGTYDQVTDTFQVTATPSSTTPTPYTLILYDNDTTSSVSFIEGLVFANFMRENSWTLSSGGTQNATISFPNQNLPATGLVYGNNADNTLSASSGQASHLYGLQGDDVLTGNSAADYISGGNGADIITGSAGADVVDVGDSAYDGTRGDGAQDIVIINAVGGSSSDSAQVSASGAVTQMNGASTVSGGSETGQDYIYSFELQRDIVRIAAVHVDSFDPASNLSVISQRVNNDFVGDTSIAQYTLMVNLDGGGMGSGDVAVTFRNWQTSGATTFADRVQYVLSGNGVNNTLVGGVLDDTLDGGSGNDTVLGALGNDSLIGALGNDSLLGGDGDDTLVGGADADTLLGGIGNDLLIVDGDVSSGERLDGGSGSNDRLWVLGDTNLSGAAQISNIDRFVLADSVDAVFKADVFHGVTLTLDGTGNNGNEAITLEGSSGDDNIDLAGITLDTNDIAGFWVDGGNGNDTIVGSTGNDTLVGGLGDNNFRGGDGIDSLVAGAGNDVFVYDNSSQTATANTVSLMDTISGLSTTDTIDLRNLTGYVDGSTTLTTVSGDDYILSWKSQSGNTTNYLYLQDTMVLSNFSANMSSGVVTFAATSPATFAGVDVTYTASVAGTLRLVQFGQQSTIRGNSDLTYAAGETKVYTIKPSTETPTPSTRFGYLQFQPGGGNTRLSVPDTSTFVLDGADTAETISIPSYLSANSVSNATGVYSYGFDGHDSILGFDGPDLMLGGNDNDTLVGGNGNDQLLGQNGLDSLVGGLGNDTLSGGMGADTLLGGDGVDSLIGGGGADNLTGGSGSDVFILEESDVSSGVDVINDFSAGNSGDQIDFYGSSAFVSGVNDFAFGSASADLTLSNGHIYLIADSGTTPGVITTNDFNTDSGQNLVLGNSSDAWLVVGETSTDDSLAIYHASRDAAGILTLEKLADVTLVGGASSNLGTIVAGNIVL